MHICILRLVSALGCGPFAHSGVFGVASLCPPAICKLLTFMGSSAHGGGISYVDESVLFVLVLMRNV